MRQLDKRKIYYVYEHYKPNCDEPFWVGKGKFDRAYHYKGKHRNRYWHNIVNKYGEFEIRFVADKLSEIDALWLENICIVGWGRADKKEGPLANLTDGGDGSNGYKPPRGKKHFMFGKTGAKCPTSKIVQTPRGIFESCTAAAKAYDISQSNMSRRCRNNIGYKYVSDTQIKNNRKGINYRKFPVQTPLGVFESASKAAKAHNVCRSTMARRCRKMINGCYYLSIRE